ncbi:zinc ribbon domain-containing protein [Naasia sp. SYSU D00948]|uniref:zinc ribbon domain-containing protein n=1 Tax=Naasia sp. SYSU D00948 TaxID=2817379 RepID=UPI001B3159B0|nr:zinc ribbon domain-containing protein [Naasia sp. SYSU D00948]
MTCAACGADLPPGAMFCGECGTAATGRIPAAAPAERPAPTGPALVLDDRTRLPAIRTTPTAARFVLQFSTGEAVTVSGTGLIGRRPQAQPGEEFDVLVAIDDPGRSVSKTHLEFGQEGGAFWVSDRFSANGTVVREPDRSARLCAPGMRTRVARGSRVEMGEQFFVVS